MRLTRNSQPQNTRRARRLIGFGHLHWSRTNVACSDLVLCLLWAGVRHAILAANLALLSLAQAPSELLLNRNGSNAQFNGIGQFRGSSTCTVVLVNAGNDPAAPAYALSNGHCVGFLSANEIWLDRAPGANWRVLFNFFQDTTAQQLTVNVRRVVWAAIKGTDLAVLELAATVGELRAAGLQSWNIAAEQPQPGEPIQIIGIPVSGVPAAQAYLRRATCTMGAQADLIEFHWRFRDMWFNDCADIKGGSSGSPVLSVPRQQLLALINTTTAESPPYGDCYLGRPCEIFPDGAHVRERTNYAVPLQGVSGCFDEAGKFVLTRAACQLDRGKQLQITGYPPTATQPWVRDNATGALQRATWNITISGTDFAYYRYKAGREGTTDCRVADGYSAVIKLSENNRFNDELPEREGRAYFCLQGGNAPQVDETWQPLQFATQVHVAIDTTPPALGAVYQVRALTNDRWQVQPIFVVPELASYLYKFGKAGTLDCAAQGDYRDYLRVPINVSNAEGAQTFCLIGRDNAYNQTPPRELLLERGRWFELLGARVPARTRSGLR